MADEVLRMRATVVSEEALANIRAIGREIGMTPQRAGKGVAEVNKQFDSLSGSVKKVTGDFKALIPGIAGFGVGAASFGAAAVTLVGTLSSLSRKLVDLKFASDELGMPTQEIRAFQQAAEKVNIEGMMGKLQAFKAVTEGLRYDMGGVRSELYARGAAPLVAQLQGAATQGDKLRVALTYLQRLAKEPGGLFRAQQLGQLLGLGPEAVRLLVDNVNAEFNRLKPSISSEAAQKFKDQLTDLGEAWDHMLDKFGAAYFPGLTKLVQALEHIIDLQDKISNHPLNTPGGARKIPTPPGTYPTPPGEEWWKHPFRLFTPEGPEGPPPAEKPRTGWQRAFPFSDPRTLPDAEPYGPFLPGGPEAAPKAPLTPSQMNDLRARPGAPGIKPISFQPGGGPIELSADAFRRLGQQPSEGGEPSRIIKVGVLDALIEFQSYVHGGGGAGGGFQNASLRTGGMVPTGGMPGMPGFGGVPGAPGGVSGAPGGIPGAPGGVPGAPGAPAAPGEGPPAVPGVTPSEAPRAGDTPSSSANVRYNNPGAQYPLKGKLAEAFGQTGVGIIGGGHQIARFQTPVHGAAANMNLLMRKYTGMTIAAATRKWSGGSRAVPGPGGKPYDPNTVITPAMMQDPTFAIPFMQAISRGEAKGNFPLSQAQWEQAHQWAVQGGSQGQTALPRTPGGQTPPAVTAPGAPAVPGAAPGSSGEMGPASALAFARQHLGEDEIRDQSKLQDFFRSKNISINPRTTAWCAAFVNANLASAGIKGTGSLAAGSFTNYGTAVKPGEVQPGDIGVVRGRSSRTGIEGQHVGFLTGESRMNNGVLEYKMLGGNQGGTSSGRGGVSEQWRSASSLHLRRPLAPGSAPAGTPGAPAGTGGTSGTGGMPATGGMPRISGMPGGIPGMGGMGGMPGLGMLAQFLPGPLQGLLPMLMGGMGGGLQSMFGGLFGGMGQRGTDRLDRAINAQSGGAALNATGNVNVNVHTNGTKASTDVKSDGLFQQSTVRQHRQMRPTEQPEIGGGM